jgi:hypothetical protein
MLLADALASAKCIGGRQCKKIAVKKVTVAFVKAAVASVQVNHANS